MKRIYFVGCLLLFTISPLTAQNWIWGKEGNSPIDINGPVAADNTGDVYFGGAFNNTISFGSITLNNPYNMFLVKYDGSGNVLWALQPQLKNFGLSAAAALFSDSVGNVYVAGTFKDSVLFGTSTLHCFSTNTFVTKYDPSGNAQWAAQSQTLSKSSFCFPNCITEDKWGNIFVAGTFIDTVYFSSYALYGTKTGSPFLAKYNPSGILIWAKQGISKNYAYGESVACDNQGNAFVTGSFSDSLNFPPYSLYNAYNNPYTFLVKYDFNGNVKWVKQSQSSSNANWCGASGVVSDADGNAYVTGTLTQGINTFGPYSLTGFNFFLVKYDSSGNLRWAKQSLHGGESYSMAIDKNNMIYISGGWTDSLDFGGNSQILGNYTNLDESFIIKVDTSGKTLCSSLIPAGGDDQNSITCSPSGIFVYLGGDIADTFTFNHDFLSSPNGEFPFVARWWPCLCQLSNFNFDFSSVTCYIGNDGSITAKNVSGIPPYTYYWSNGATSQTLSGLTAGTYSLTISDSTGCVAEQNIILPTKEGCNLFIPNAFSPNGDGQNDELLVKGSNIATFYMAIYNRWGTIVFESRNISYGWNGEYNNKPENIGTYVYYLYGTYTDGSTFEKTGSIALVR